MSERPMRVLVPYTLLNVHLVEGNIRRLEVGCAVSKSNKYSNILRELMR